MALRLYFVTLTGTGTSADAFRLVGRQGSQFDLCDGRPDVALATGEMVVVFDVTPAQHASLVATGGVTYLPCEDTLGGLAGPNETIATISAANRATIQTLCEARHIPTGWLSGSDPVKRLWRFIAVRFLCRQVLGGDDWTELLDSLVSSIPAQKRSNINAKLTAAGYDTSVIQGSDTVREAIRKIGVQTVRLSRTGSD